MTDGINVSWAVKSGGLRDCSDSVLNAEIEWLKRTFSAQSIVLNKPRRVPSRYPKNRLWGLDRLFQNPFRSGREEIQSMAVVFNDTDLLLHSNPRFLPMLMSKTKHTIMIRNNYIGVRSLRRSRTQIIYPLFDSPVQRESLLYAAKMARAFDWTLLLLYKHQYAVHPWHLTRLAVDMCDDPLLRFPYYEWEEAAHLNITAEVVEHLKLLGTRISLHTDPSIGPLGISLSSVLRSNRDSLLAMDPYFVTNYYYGRVLKDIRSSGFDTFMHLSPQFLDRVVVVTRAPISTQEALKPAGSLQPS